MTTQPPLTAEALRQALKETIRSMNPLQTGYHMYVDPHRLMDRLEALSSPAPSPEFSWVVERGDTARPEYWAGGREWTEAYERARKFRCRGIAEYAHSEAHDASYPVRVCEHGTLPAPASAPPPAGEGTQALRQRLMMFYQVKTTDELIAIQDRHIERLQAKLRQHSDEPLAMRRVREG